MKIATIVGARPQFVKAAALGPALRRVADESLIHTGQHYDPELSQVFFDELGLAKPDHHLGVGSGPHGAQTGEMLKRLEPILVSERPDVVLVYGDTNSTLAGALAAAKLHLPVAHVEAGLRSFDRRMPEEVNRVLTDHLSTWLFCPSPHAAANLAREGITEGVEVVGDVMEEVITARLGAARARSDRLKEFGVDAGAYALATVHRAENTDDPHRLASIVDGLNRISRGGLPVLLPLHPRTEHALARTGLSLGAIRATRPLPYGEMLSLLANARVVLTDSGGLQKESRWAGVPCVTLREETEWTDTVGSGWNTLTGADAHRIEKAALAARPGDPSSQHGPLGASGRIVASLQAGLDRRPKRAAVVRA